jgi:hypothetical protein
MVMHGTGQITVAPQAGVTIFLAGTGQTGNRTVASYGVGALVKVGTDTWFISGQGVV